MAPRENELPEGTDHIINGAMETDIDTGGASAGGQGGTGSGGGGSVIGAGTGSGGAGAGGGSMATTDTNGSGNGGGGEAGGGSSRVVEQLRSQAYALRDQAGERVRDFADGGKTRASDALEDLARVVGDTADSIDERLGGEYAEYARRAADAVSGFADTLRRKEVDELYQDVSAIVRKSPAVAVGVAAVVGFTLARLVKAGLTPEQQGGGGSGGSGGGGTTGA